VPVWVDQREGTSEAYAKLPRQSVVPRDLSLVGQRWGAVPVPAPQPRCRS